MQCTAVFLSKVVYSIIIHVHACVDWRTRHAQCEVEQVIAMFVGGH